MKKIALLLVLTLLFVFVVTSCVNDEPVSEAESSAQSSETESSAEASSRPATSSKSETSSKAPTIPISETAEFCTVISTGCPYTSNVAADANYQDSYGAELTDGLFVESEKASYSESRLSGFAPGSLNLMIVIDLGKTQDKLYRFEASYLTTYQAGIAPPSNILVHTSNDGEVWSYNGSCKKPDAVAETMQTAIYDSTEYISARYVRFTFYKSSAWIFFDELQVCADVESEADDGEYIKKLTELYAGETLTSGERTGLLSSVRGDSIDRDLNRVLISKGAKYKSSVGTKTGYTDSGSMLTDGTMSYYLEGNTWVGYDGTADMNIVLDLGKKRSDLAEFEVSAYANKGSGSAMPLCIKVSVSDDNSAFTEVGRIYGPASSSFNYIYTLSLSRAVSGRYVRFDFASAGAKLTLIEECAVYGYGTEEALPLMYPEVVLPQVDSDELWPASDSDYKTEKNLIRGLGQQIMVGDDGNADVIVNNTKVASKLLTDGKYSRNVNIHSGDFFKFNHGASRDVIYDLGKLSALTSFKVSFVRYTDWAVNTPDSVTIHLSDDGKTWYPVCVLIIPTDKDNSTIQVEQTLDRPLAARFVAFSFTVAGWVGADEFEAIGTKDASSATRLSKCGKTGIPLASTGYRNSDEDTLGGASDICLMYHGQSYKNTEETLLPYVAYLDAEGNIKDRMFDGFLFLLSGTFPSGVAGHLGSTMSDWNWILDQLFAEGSNLDALNKTGDKVSKALGDNEKLNFYVTIYYPRISVTSFGDVDGDGVSENFTVLANRLKAVDWFITEFERRLAAANYDNLNFSGYYWYHEAISGSDEDPESLELLNGISALVHKHNSQFFWIPYFTSNGYSRWATYGFDIACMQPNYAFKDFVLESRLDVTARLIKRFNMCIEMEIDDQALRNGIFFEKYMDYLAHGVYDGYMKESLHMYYQGTQIFYNACYSPSEKLRLIYDYTYQFIKKQLSVYPEKLDDIALECALNTPLQGTLAFSESEIYSFDCAISPEHGTVSVCPDGSFIYYPDSDFKGTDSFSYTYSEQLGDSEYCTVTITVG